MWGFLKEWERDTNGGHKVGSVHRWERLEELCKHEKNMCIQILIKTSKLSGENKRLEEHEGNEKEEEGKEGEQEKQEREE